MNTDDARSEADLTLAVYENTTLARGALDAYRHGDRVAVALLVERQAQQVQIILAHLGHLTAGGSSGRDTTDPTDD